MISTSKLFKTNYTIDFSKIFKLKLVPQTKVINIEIFCNGTNEKSDVIAHQMDSTNNESGPSVQIGYISNILTDSLFGDSVKTTNSTLTSLGEYFEKEISELKKKYPKNKLSTIKFELGVHDGSHYVTW